MSRFIAVSVALAWLLTSWSQGSKPPVTIEALQDVDVIVNRSPNEPRGKLCLEDSRDKPFTIKKGERFQMVRVASEGGCRIRHEEKEFNVTSCPWLEGFRDHQTDFFRVIR